MHRISMPVPSVTTTATEFKIFPNLAMPDEDNQNHQEHMAFDQMTVGDLK